uniref:Uncharacterized protein n=1 Tax=Rhodococcus sp. NS1 TaxID=402236 RepID=A0A097SQU2_9NOCA|nr:hypothetical protein LRS1606.467 [Rhodococcus sp. NS1]
MSWRGRRICGPNEGRCRLCPGRPSQKPNEQTSLVLVCSMRTSARAANRPSGMSSTWGSWCGSRSRSLSPLLHVVVRSLIRGIPCNPSAFINRSTVYRAFTFVSDSSAPCGHRTRRY